LQTFPTTRSIPGGSGGHFGADDPGLIVGGIHSHPGADRIRELSDVDISSATGNATLSAR
jgi:hypothetical protein